MEHRSVGPYRTVERLGAGGMGEVHLAVDTRLDRNVALKYLSSPLLDTPRARERLLREARAAAQITHPNIAAIYDIVDGGDDPFIVMEYAQGETLASLASRGPLPCALVCRIGVQLADALAHAHAAGVIHRDLKPANVVLTSDEVVKVLDFGLARIHDVDTDAEAADAPTVTIVESHPGKLAGTPAYMAPEQLTGQPASPLSDIYSLGATLYEVLTGRRPFAGATTAEVVYAVLSTPTPRVSAANRSVPPVLDAIVARAMSRDMARRYQTATDLLEDLRHAQSACDTPPGIWLPVARRAAALTTALSRRGVVVTAVGVVAAAIGMATYWRTAPPPAALGVATESVAVLPFTNPSRDPALDLGAAAFSASIVDGLEGLSSITVVSRRDTAEHFAGPAGVQKGARELGVEMIVSGTVSRRGAGSRFQVTVAKASGQIVSARTYDLVPGSATSPQRQAIKDLVSVLGTALTPEDRERLERGPTCLGDAYADYATGLALLERQDVVGNARKAEDAFLRTVARDPNCAPGFAGLADARWARYRDTRDPALAGLASEAITAALRLDERNPSIQMSMARVYLEQGKADQAERSVRLVIAARPRDDAPRRLLGDVLYSLKRTEEAVAAYEKAIALRPANVLNHLSLGVCYYQEGRYREAIGPYEEALRIQPDHMWAIGDLGAAHDALGEWDKALAVFNTAPKRDPTILTNIGNVYYEKGLFAEAARAFEEAVDQAPRDDIKRRNLGDLYRRLRQTDKAQAQYRVAAEITGDMLRRVNAQDAKVMARHALYLAKLGRRADAIRYSEQAARLSPDDNDVLYKRAVVYCLLNQPSEAIDGLRLALQKHFSVSRAKGDDDLEALRARPDFAALMRSGQ